MKFLFFLFQIVALYLISRGGLVLAFAGFSREERHHAKVILSKRLSICALIAFIFFVSLGSVITR
jgi:hypothetical protein